MTNLAYFFTTLIITIVVFIIDGISHHKFNRKANIIFHIFGWGLVSILAIVLLIKEFKLTFLIYPGIILILFSFILVYLSYPEIKENFLSVKWLTKTGIYSAMRHPMYLSLIILFISLPLFSLSLFVSLYSMVSIIMIFWLVNYEEKHLIKKFGKKYLNYKKEVPMFLPKLNRQKKIKWKK